MPSHTKTLFAFQTAFSDGRCIRTAISLMNEAVMRSKTGALWHEKRNFISADANAAGQPVAVSGLFTDFADGAITNQKFLDSMQAPNEGHFPINTIDQSLGTINDPLAPTLGELSGAFSNALQAQSRHASASNGDGTAGSVAQPAPNTIIDAGATTRWINYQSAGRSSERWNSLMHIRGPYRQRGNDS